MVYYYYYYYFKALAVQGWERVNNSKTPKSRTPPNQATKEEKEKILEDKGRENRFGQMNV